MEQLTTALNAVQGKLQKMTATAKETVNALARAPSQAFAGLAANLDGIAGKLQSVSSLAMKLAAAGGGFIGFFARGAAAGTVEGERLGKAFEYLTRVIGGMFAPYVEALTQGLVALAKWFQNLDGGLKAGIAKWFLIGTAVAGLVALLPTVIGGMAAIATVIAGLLTPIGMLLVGVGSIGGAFLFAGDEGQSFGQRMEKWITRTTELWLQFKHVIIAVGIELKSVWMNLTDYMPRGDFYFNFGEMEKNRKDLAKALKALREGGPTGIGQSIDDLINKFKGLQGQFAGTGAQFTMKGTIGFENFQGTFDRLQKAFAEDPGLDVAKATLEGVNKVAETLQTNVPVTVADLKGVVGP